MAKRAGTSRVSIPKTLTTDDYERMAGDYVESFPEVTPGARAYLDSLGRRPAKKPVSQTRPRTDKTNQSMAVWLDRMAMFSDDPEAIRRAAEHNHKKGF